MLKENPFRNMGRLSPKQLEARRRLDEGRERREELEGLEAKLQAEMVPEIKKRNINVWQVRRTNNGEEIVILGIPKRLGPKGFEPEGPVKIALLKDIETAVEEVADQTKFKDTQREKILKMIQDKLENKTRMIDPAEIQHNVETDETGKPIEQEEYRIYNLVDECNNRRAKLRQESNF